MVNSITAAISGGNEINVFDTATINVAIKDIIIYNKSSSSSNVTFKFNTPDDFVFLTIPVQSGETIFIDNDVYVPANNYLKVSSDQDTNLVFNFIEDSKTNIIVWRWKMITSSFNLASNSSISFRTSESTSGGSGSTSSVANIINIESTINSDTISYQDNSKELSKVIGNIIKIIDLNDQQILGEIYITNDDISIDTSNSDYNTISITLPVTDFDQKTAIFSMY